MSNVTKAQVFSCLTHVRPEWIDINGHMNMSYYVLIFDTHGHEMLQAYGFGDNYVKQRRLGLFIVRAEIDYRREVLVNDRLRLTMQVTGFDRKRLWFEMDMYHAEKNYHAASIKQLAIIKCCVFIVIGF